MAESLYREVEQHYTTSELGASILSALEDFGRDIDRLKPEDLVAVDEFHVRSREANRELAHEAGLTRDLYVLDVGSGIGGPARNIAHEFGCRVAGIDLCEEYCSVAAMLTERVGLSHLVTFKHGNALDLPFADAAFDVVWTQHAAMNIPDKATLYAQAYRVLKPGGVLALYDVLAGPSGPVLFPVPWARSAGTSFLVTPEELRRLVTAAGFRITSWHDRTGAALTWFTDVAARARTAGPPLGIHLLLGPDYPGMARNLVQNVREGRVVLAQVVARKDS